MYSEEYEVLISKEFLPKRITSVIRKTERVTDRWYVMYSYGSMKAYDTNDSLPDEVLEIVLNGKCETSYRNGQRIERYELEE